MTVRPRVRHLSRVVLGVALAGCAPAVPAGTAPPPTARSSEAVRIFPAAAFADISEATVSAEAAAALQSILDGAIPEDGSAGGITATVMSANGSWSGAVGTADGIRDMRPDDQMAVGSVTKSVVAAQVMQLVEAGDLALDDPASDYLPGDLDFDTNQATIRHLLTMRSGIPDCVDALWRSLTTDRLRAWTPEEALGRSLPIAPRQVRRWRIRARTTSSSA